MNPTIFVVSFLKIFLCGYARQCSVHDSSWAAERAVENAERHFSVIGVLEEMEKTLYLLDAKLPRFFAGVSKIKSGEGNTIVTFLEVFFQN